MKCSIRTAPPRRGRFGQWSAAISDGLRNLHAAGYLPDGTDPEDLAVTFLTAVQGGLLLAQVQRDTRPVETAIDTLLQLTGISPRGVPAETEMPRRETAITELCPVPGREPV